MGVSLLSLKLPVPKELSRLQGESQSVKIPAVNKFQKSGLFQNRGNFNLEGFQGKMKLPIFGKFPGLNREFHPELHPYFWNSRIQKYFKTAGMFCGGSFITLCKTVCMQGVETNCRRVMNLKRFPRLLNSKNLDYFKIAGILIWRGFRVK